jgi:glutamyl-tRNA synthetase
LNPAPVPAEKREPLRILVPLVQERLKRLQDVVELTDFIFNDIETASGEALLGKNMTPEQSLEALKAAHTLLSKTLSFDAATLEPQMRQLAEDLGLKTGQLFTILRVAVSNKKVAPPLFGSIEALGRQTTLKGIARAEDDFPLYLQKTPHRRNTAPSDRNKYSTGSGILFYITNGKA